MVYLNNNTELQEVWIPKNDGTGSSHKPTNELESVDVTISQDITVVHPSSGYYGMSAVTIDASEYGQSNYDEGFDDGYTDGYSSGTSDGEQSIIDTFTSTTITINGQYGSSANPYSSVTVNVAQTGHTDQELQDAYNSGYTSGSTDGYNSGYTSGETHQKSLLVSTAFTENGTYTRENGYSAITVNVPTGQTYNIEQNKPFTATSNGNYTIAPSSGITTVTDRFDSDLDRYYCTVNVDMSSYPSSGYFELVRIEDEFDESKGYVDIYIDNGVLDYDNSWNPREDADIDGWVGSVDIVIYNANRHIGWSLLSDFDFQYDVMSAVSLNVNVDTASTYQSGYTSGYTDGYDSGSTDGFNSGYTSGTTDGYASGYTDGYDSGSTDGYQNGYTVGTNDVISTFTTITATTNGVYGSSANPLSSITVNVPTGSSETDIIIVTTGACWFTTNYQIDYGDSIEIEHCTFGTPILPYPGTHQQYVGGNSSEVFRIGQNEYGLYLKYFSNFNSGGHIIYFPSSGSILEDNTITFSSTGFTVDGNVVTSYTTTEISSIATLIFFANNSSGVDVVERQTAKMGRVKVYAPDGTLKATFEPRLDNLNVPYFKYVEQDIDIYASGSGTPSFEILDPYFYSGYTIGYNSGYTDGSAYIASLIDRSITEVVIPSGVTTIGQQVFNNCRSLSSVTIPNSVTSIGGNAFQYCTSLSSVTIPNSVTSIGGNAFASCSNLSSVTISNSITKIESFTFYSCPKLSSITIPNSVATIGGNVFESCSELIEVNIGSGVTKIDAKAFRSCIALSNIYISATTAPTISNANAFQGVPSTGTVHYPQGSDYSSWQSNTYLSGWTFIGDL